MTVRKLFVSHSSKTPDNLALLKAICEGLEESIPATADLRYRIIYDRDGAIVGGDDWYHSIDQWMIEANAAIILFSRAALFDSDWVKKEAAILAWRQQLDPDFVLIPVLLDGLTPEELDKGLFGVLRIRSRQCIRNADDAGQVIMEVHRALAAKAPLLDCSDRDFNGASFEPLEGIVALLIASRALPDALSSVVTNLGLNRPTWPPEEYKRNACSIARYLVSDRAASLERLNEFLNVMNPRLPQDAAEQLFAYLRGVWVNRISAAGLPAAWQMQKAIGLNGINVENYTAKCYCERAWSLDASWKLVRVEASSHTLDDIQSDIDAQISKTHAFSLSRIQRRIVRAKHPYILVIPHRLMSPGTSKDVVEELRQRYPGAIVLVDVGSSRPAWLPDSIELLDPPLVLEEEEVQLDAFDATLDLFDNLYGSP